MAFIAPIPSAKTSAQTQSFNTTRNKLLRPRIGSFDATRSFDYQENHAKITISGNVSLDNDKNIANYKQKIVIRDSASNKSVNEVREVSRSIPVISMDFESTTSSNSMVPALDDYGTFVYFTWHGITHMIRTYGNSQQWVKYEHPDNYYTYHPQQWNLQWDQSVGNGYGMIHHSQSTVYQAIQANSIWVVAMAIADAAIGMYLLTLAAITLAAWIVAGLLAILTVYFVAVGWWLEHVLKAEQDDGWPYTYWNGVFLQASYGGWKDLWIYSWG